MKKNVLIKGILVLLVIALLTIGFTGCAPTYPYPTTGTVYITVDTWDDYSIYMDYSYQGYTGWYGSFTIYNVPTGYHTFEADGYYYGYYGYKTQYIYPGANYVTIYTY
jgi:hypothetical protein